MHRERQEMNAMPDSRRSRGCPCRRVFIASAFLLLGACASPEAGGANDAGGGSGGGGGAAGGGGGGARVVQLGFNAKGTLDTDAQVAYARAMLDAMSPAARSRIHVRVTGGTRSQTEIGRHWEKSQLDAWIGLQDDYGIGLVFVVNGNDPPAAQAQFVQRWIDGGATFSFLEMMNEYYLPRYRNGDTSFEEVTKQVTAESYTTEILPAYMAALSRFGLPMFVIAAPEKGNPELAAWNDTIVSAFAAHADWAGVTVHLYETGATFDYAQIDALRARLPPGTPIAITECGVTDESITSYAQAAERFAAHERTVLSFLKPGDYLFDQVLYLNDADKYFTATLHPSSGGLTEKGAAIVDLFESP